MRCIITLFLICNFGSILYSQNIAQTLEMAMNDAQLGYVDAALKKYQRILFFGDSETDILCFDQLGKIHYQKGEFAKAIRYFDLVKINAKDVPQRANASFDKIACLIMRDEFLLAQSELFQIPNKDTFLSRKHFYQGIIHLENGESEYAKQSFLNLLEPQSEIVISRIDSVFQELDKWNRRKPKTAKLLSMLVPGAGQLYAKDYKNAANSAMLNGLAIFLFVETAKSVSLLDALFSVIPFFYKYYEGGYRAAEYSILEGQQLEKAKLLTYVIKSLQ